MEDTTDGIKVSRETLDNELEQFGREFLNNSMNALEQSGEFTPEQIAEARKEGEKELTAWIEAGCPEAPQDEIDAFLSGSIIIE